MAGGRLVEARAVAGANGTFRAELALDAGEWEVTATFAGGGGYKPSSSAIKISVPRALSAEIAVALAAVAVIGAILIQIRKKKGIINH